MEGAGAGPVFKWMDLMRKIQNGGKSLYVYCEPWEVPELLKGLSPTGLIMVVKERLRQHEAKELVEIVGGLSYP